MDSHIFNVENIESNEVEEFNPFEGNYDVRQMNATDPNTITSTTNIASATVNKKKDQKFGPISAKSRWWKECPYKRHNVCFVKKF